MKPFRNTRVKDLEEADAKLCLESRNNRHIGFPQGVSRNDHYMDAAHVKYESRMGYAEVG